MLRRTEVPCCQELKEPKCKIVPLSPQAKSYLGMPAIISSPGMRQLIELAEAQFHKELSERMRPRVRKLQTFERGGLHT